MNAALKPYRPLWAALAFFGGGWAPVASQPPGTPATIAVPLPDSAALRPNAPEAARPEEAVKLTAQGSFAAERAAAGDTVAYTLRVEWKDMSIPVVVMAPESLETPGFRVAGQSAAHRKTAANGEIRNVTEFTYKLVPKAPGSGRVAALKLRYITGLANREEALYVPGAFLDIGPARVPLSRRPWFIALASLLLLAAAGAGGRFALQAMAARKKKAVEKEPDFSASISALKSRCQNADSRAWLEEAERLCLDYLRRRLGAEYASAKLDALLERHLAHSPADAEGWNRLRELFHHARYAGGRKEPHELQDAVRILKTCFHITGENEP